VSPGGGGTLLRLNGQELPPGTDSVDVPLEKPLELVASREGYREFRQEFFVDSQERQLAAEKTLEIQLDPINPGYLSVSTTPSADAFISIQGSEWKKATPFEKLALPEGSYRIRLVNEALALGKTVTVTLGAGKVTVVNESLVQAESN
jgi:hypothetical protein